MLMAYKMESIKSGRDGHATCSFRCSVDCCPCSKCTPYSSPDSPYQLATGHWVLLASSSPCSFLTTAASGFLKANALHWVTCVALGLAAWNSWVAHTLVFSSSSAKSTEILLKHATSACCLTKQQNHSERIDDCFKDSHDS